MTYLELVQMVLREAGITQSVSEPQTLSSLTGLGLKVKNWVAQAWEDFKMENDQSELTRDWFSTTVTPRVAFDTGSISLRQPGVGNILTGQASGARITVVRTTVTNGGSFGNRTAEGYIEFESLEGQPFPNEYFLGPIPPTPPPIPGVPNPPAVRVGFRFLRFGDYKLDSQVEMGTGYISNLADVWWDTLVISDNPLYTTNCTVRERSLQYVDWSRFSKNFDTNIQVTSTPTLVTELPSDGARVYFYPPCDRPYLLSGYYYKKIPPLVNDSDVPIGLKEAYHPMLAWRALSYYGQYDIQGTVIQQAASRYQVFKKKYDREAELPVALRPVRLY